MQTGFGGVSEIQQFLVDGGGGGTSAHPFFLISSATLPPTINSVAAGGSGHEICHPSVIPHASKLTNALIHSRPQYLQQAVPPQTLFPHFHSNIPITQQLFTPPPHHHHFQLFQNNHHDHFRLLPASSAIDHEPEQENSVNGPLLHGGGPPPSFLAANMKFKLAVDNDQSRGGCRADFDNDNDVTGSILHGDNTSESRLRSWHRQETCTIKEPIWRPLDLDFINSSNKRFKEKETAELPLTKRRRVTGELENSHATVAGSNYKLFSELEAIYKPGGAGGSNSTATETVNNNQIATTHAANQTTGSGSALTGDDYPLIPSAATGAFDLDYRLEDNNSTGGKTHTDVKKGEQQHSSRRRRKSQMGSIAAFFKGVMNQLIDHQEALHQKFLDAMDQRDRERAEQEEAWRDQEAARLRLEAAACAHDRGLAAAREAAIISFLEKITGETITFPPHPKFKDSVGDDFAKGGDFNPQTTSRWPKVEVQALIQVRSRLDAQFQEPGLKGPLWEEVSAAMTAMGYRRSAKRCKEKWENINKYFRKSRDSGRKRPEHSKTCPYFHQLDQLYPKSGLSQSDAIFITGENQRCAREEVAESDAATAMGTTTAAVGGETDRQIVEQ